METQSVQSCLVDADESKLHDTLQRIRDLAVMSAGKVEIPEFRFYFLKTNFHLSKDQLELENLRNRLDEGVGREEIEELAEMVEKEGMKLERDSGVPLFNEIEKLEAKQSGNYSTNFSIFMSFRI